MLDSRLMDTLRELALRGCTDNYVLVKTGDLARKLGKSQQSASSFIIELEKAGLIHRIHAGRASKIMITDKGRDRLWKRFSEYRRIFHPTEEETLILSGTVVTGFGEGSYYISLPHYWGQIKEKLGFEPYSGTFNVKIEPESVPELNRLRNRKSISINGFEDKGRTFGKVDCYPCRVDGEMGAIIIPERTHYRDSIEVISPLFLREKLNKKEKDRVCVEVPGI